jgi:hypothetical protein
MVEPLRGCYAIPSWFANYIIANRTLSKDGYQRSPARVISSRGGDDTVPLAPLQLALDGGADEVGPRLAVDQNSVDPYERAIGEPARHLFEIRLFPPHARLFCDISYCGYSRYLVLSQLDIVIGWGNGDRSHTRRRAGLVGA